MSYTPIDIPFFTGQDESFDKKVLPIGPLSRVQNAFLERNGRMVEKYGMVSRPTASLDGEDHGSLNFRNSLPNDTITVERAGGIFAAKYSDDGVRLMDGRHATALGYEATLTAVGSAAGSDTWSPSVAVTSTHVIFAYCSGTSQQFGYQWVVDIYTRDDLVLVRRMLLPASAGQASQIKVGASTSSKSFVVANRRNESVSIQYFADETSEDWGDAEHDLPCVPDSTFDLSDATDASDVFGVVIYDSADNQVRVTSFRRAPGLPILGTYASEPDGIPDETQYIFCACALINFNNLFVVYTYHNGDGYIVSRNSRLDGVSNGTEHFVLASPVGAPNLAIRPASSQCILVYGHAELTQLYLISLDNAIGNNQKIEQSFPVAAPYTTSTSSNTGDMRGYITVAERPRTPYEYDEPAEPQTSENTGDIRGTISVCAPDFIHLFGNPCAVLQSAGSSNFTRTFVGRHYGASFSAPLRRWTPSKVPVAGRHVFFCLEQRLPQGTGNTIGGVSNDFDAWTTAASVRVLTSRAVRHGIFAESWDNGAVVAAGAAVSVINDPVNHFGGFTGAPKVLLNVFEGAGGNSLPIGIYQYICILEYIDPTGRLWSSVPSDPATVTTSGIGAEQETPTYSATVCAGSPIGTRKVFYRTEEGDSTFFRLRSVAYDAGTLSDFVTDDKLNPPEGGLVPYTAGGVVDNDPPPLGRFIARTRNRFWVGNQEFPSRVQASKFLRPTEGIHWNNSDAFTVDIPENITGLAATDEVLVCFCADGIYIVRGEGPNDQGIGSFPAPQKIPCESGCVQPRSIQTADAGIYFMSARGLELINRGFSAPQFVGDAVQDITDEHRFCEGSIILQELDQIRWLLTNGVQTQGRRAVVVVLDIKKSAWSVFQYGGDGPLGIGRVKSTSNLYPADGAAHYSNFLNGATRESLERNSTAFKDMIFETGFIRPFGLQAGALGRRMNVLGTYKAPCSIKVEMAFNDAKDFHPTWVKTWELTGTDYSTDDPVQLELTLPKQKFDSVRFRLTATRSEIGSEAFQAHGLTVFVDTEGEGPRVGARSKG